MEKHSITTKTLKSWIADFELIVAEMKRRASDCNHSPDQTLKHTLKQIASTDLIGKNVRLFKQILQSREEAQLIGSFMVATDKRTSQNQESH